MHRSAVTAMTSLAEAAVVIFLLVGLAAGTVALVGPIFGFLQGPRGPNKMEAGKKGSCIPAFEPGILPEGWFKTWRKTWPILGAFYMAAGRVSGPCHCANLNLRRPRVKATRKNAR